MQTLARTFLQCRDSNDLYRKQLWKGRQGTAVSELLRTEYWHREKQREYVTDYSSFRNNHHDAFDEESWIKMSLAHYEQPDTLYNRKRLCESLSANRLMAKFVWQARNDKRYDFFKHSSDLVDGQQLAYLADPVMHFVSNDRKLRSRIANSPQSSRVLSWRDLPKLA
jgi:hypothetical protein